MVQRKLEFSIKLSIDKYSDGTINYELIFYLNYELHHLFSHKHRRYNCKNLLSFSFTLVYGDNTVLKLPNRTAQSATLRQ